MTKYLSGTIHYLAPSVANKRYPKNAYTVHQLEDDGTVSVYQLVDKPVQHGQVPFQERGNRADQGLVQC